MEKRIKLFWNLECTERQINDWLEKTQGKLHETHFIAWPIDFDQMAGHAAMLVYTPEEENEKEVEWTKESKKSDGGIQRRNSSLRRQEWPHCEIEGSSNSDCAI